MPFAKLSGGTLEKMKQADVLVPCPLMLDEKGRMLVSQQECLTRYYIDSGAAAVVPGTHTGQFARGSLELYAQWLELVARVQARHGDSARMFRMAAVGGPRGFEMLRLAKEAGFEVVMIAPTALVDSRGQALDEKDSLALLREMASVTPVYGFYLQRAVGGRDFSPSFWEGLFEFAIGAKAAPFDRRRTDDLMLAAVRSGRTDELVMATGNDDYIVGDLARAWTHPEKPDIRLRITAGLLGHFASETHAAVDLVRRVKHWRELDERGRGDEFLTRDQLTALAADVTAMNWAVFDSMDLPGSPPFENSVHGIHYRLRSLGVIHEKTTDIRWFGPGDAVRVECGRPGLEREIDLAYGARPHLTDDSFVTRERLAVWRSGK
jgi:dihydrodipicolinate synthase/N-acetylneuraminate lyase